MTTQDESLERAFEAYDTLGTYAAFLANLRESGWTLAPVEATYAMLVASDMAYSGAAKWRAMLAAAQEDESNG
jgi:hypothetical protein